MNAIEGSDSSGAGKGPPAIADLGERMLPASAYVTTFWEHIYRYRFALSHLVGETVLDIACGSGYGSAILQAAGRRQVIGVDVSAEACAYARAVYGVDARVGDAEHIPLPDRSVDCVVSFETIEHVRRPPAFLAECARVLVPAGRLIISTPNKDLSQSEPGAQPNPFHCSEMTKDEFVAALRQEFQSVEMYVQLLRDLPWWSRLGLAGDHTWLLRRPLMMRTRTLLQRTFSPHLVGPPAQRFRDDPIAAATVPEGHLGAHVNKYLVRRGTAANQNRAGYFVAVATL